MSVDTTGVVQKKKWHFLEDTGSTPVRAIGWGSVLIPPASLIYSAITSSGISFFEGLLSGLLFGLIAIGCSIKLKNTFLLLAGIAVFLAPFAFFPTVQIN